MRILKYDVSVLSGSFDHVMPEGARVLCVQSQGNEPKIWVLVDESRHQEEKRVFQTFLTGQTFNLPTLYEYLGTFQLNGGNFVGHVFEIMN